MLANQIQDSVYEGKQVEEHEFARSMNHEFGSSVIETWCHRLTTYLDYIIFQSPDKRT